MGYKRHKPVQEFSNSNNLALDRKLRETCIGLRPSDQRLLLELRSDQTRELIADFFRDWSDEYGHGLIMSPATKRGYITCLVYLSRYLGHKRSFVDMTRKDILEGYLANHKRDFAVDPDQKWVNTYRTRAAKLLTFWKWLTQPDLHPAQERQTPPQLKGLRFPKRKAKTSVKREHLWTPQEHKVFLDRVEDLRLACYHAIALETGGRPSELLQLKLKDIQIKTSHSTGKKYAEFYIGQYGGKGKKARPATISDAIPYYNIWHAVHPQRDDPTGIAYLFPSLEKSAKYHNKPLEEDSLRLLYSRTLKQHFTKLLLRPDVPLEEKTTIKGLIKKPSYPYLRRHEFGTNMAPKVPSFVFNQLMGHSKTSQIGNDVYVQELGDEGIKELLITKGIINRNETLSVAQQEMQVKYCPICHEANKQNADFCFSCNWIISKKGMQDVRAADEQTLKEAEETKKKLADMTIDMGQVKTQLANTTDQIATMVEILTKINRNQVTTASPEVKFFLEHKLGVMTKGRYGLIPNSDVFIDPV